MESGKVKCVIIGSFHHFYQEVVYAREDFEALGVEVLSPEKSHVLDPKEDFIILGSDPEKFSIREIEDVVLDKIPKSDFVYLVNPDGYTGKTASFEIGAAVAGQVPVFAKSVPDDVLIKQYILEVGTPEQIFEIMKKARKH
ncbi:MAG: hypothetical protein V1847_02365 [Candidatus Diapherotrites archaeon]